jgi:hypothetical protein
VIVFFLTQVGSGVIDRYAQRYDPSIRSRFAEVPIEASADLKRLPRGLMVFCDCERMTPEQRSLCQALRNEIKRHGGAFRLLNEPSRTLGRYELLRALHDRGLNDFNVHRLSELGSHVRYPVFLRVENDHSGPRSDLIHDEGALARAATRLVLQGIDSESLIAVEFVDTKAPDGHYRKYGAFRVGNRMINRHLFMSAEWCTKLSSARFDADAIREEREFMEGEDYAGELHKVFQIARIEYGRVDFAVYDGRLQVWEINDNPNWLPPSNVYRPEQIESHKKFAERLQRALLELDESVTPGPPVAVSLGSSEVWSAIRLAAT